MSYPVRSVITGDLGPLAAGLAQHLLQRGDDVALIGDALPEEAERDGVSRHHRFSFGRSDGTDREAVLDGLARADQVFLVSGLRRLPLSAEGALERLDRVVRRTINVLDASLEADANLVVVTPAEVPTGPADSIPFRSGTTLQRFAASSVNSYHRKYGLAVAHVRVPEVTTGRRVGCIGTLLNLFVHRALRGEDILVPGDGTVKTCVSCMHDVAPAIAAVAERGQAAGTGYDLGAEATSLVDLAKRVVRHTGSSSMVLVGPSAHGSLGSWFVEPADVDRAIPHRAIDALIESIAYSIRVSPILGHSA